ncbi:hypothetical protein [Bizionia sp.]|uniref:hypothetical protein n=1 Tax=Bizionia sp. TaxID=1954480 RepID=UPI003A910643
MYKNVSKHLKKNILLLIIGVLTINCKNNNGDNQSDSRLLYYAVKDSIINQSEMLLNYTSEEYVYSKSNDSIILNLSLLKNTDKLYLGADLFELSEKNKYLNLDISNKSFDLYQIKYLDLEKTQILFNEDYGLLNIYYPEWKAQLLILKNKSEFRVNNDILRIMED